MGCSHLFSFWSRWTGHRDKTNPNTCIFARLDDFLSLYVRMKTESFLSLSLPRLTESHPYLVIEALLIHDPVRMLFKFDFFLNRYHGVGRSCYPGGLPLDVWHHIMSFLKEMHLPSIVAFATNRAHADILQRICRREYVKRTAIETKISWPDVDPLIDWDRLYSLDDPSFYSECTLIATHKMLGIYNQFGMRAMSSPQIPVEVYPSDPGDKILR